MLINISAKEGVNIEQLKEELAHYSEELSASANNVIITNIRHYETLKNALAEIYKVQDGMLNNLSGDLLAIDIREALYHLGSITGEITNDELLGNIFGKFCIGK